MMARTCHPQDSPRTFEIGQTPSGVALNSDFGCHGGDRGRLDAHVREVIPEPPIALKTDHISLARRSSRPVNRRNGPRNRFEPTAAIVQYVVRTVGGRRRLS
jgi:hypothetical protein